MSTFLFRFIFVILFINLCINASKHGRLSNKGKKALEGKIVGGYESTIEDQPYQVYLLTKDKTGEYYECGGSLITPEWILTAAHCMEDIVTIRVYMGSTNHKDGAQKYKTSEFIVHPQYDAEQYNNDVALVKLPSKADINDETVKLIKLNDIGNRVEADTVLTVSGWGVLEEDGEGPENLNAVQITVKSRAYCKKRAHTTESMICAGDPGKDSCQGDSGGPAVTGDTKNNPIQVGIVSFGVGCAREKHPGVYTNVSHPIIREFISGIAGV